MKDSKEKKKDYKRRLINRRVRGWRERRERIGEDGISDERYKKQFIVNSIRHEVGPIQSSSVNLNREGETNLISSPLVISRLISPTVEDDA